MFLRCLELSEVAVVKRMDEVVEFQFHKTSIAKPKKVSMIKTTSKTYNVWNKIWRIWINTLKVEIIHIV